METRFSPRSISWTESSPIEIAGPVFDSGGLYAFEIEVRTIDEPTNIIEDSGVYRADLTIVETTSHPQEDAEGNDVEFRMKSILIKSKISNMTYYKKVTFEMPFDWSEGSMSHVPCA